MIRRSFLMIATLLAVVALHGGSEARAALIGVTFNSTPTPNWGTLSGNGSLTNLTDVNGNPTGIDLALSGVLSTITPSTSVNSIPTFTPPLPGFQGNVFTDAFFFGPLVVTISDLTPNTLYGVYAFTSREGAALNQTITITGGGLPLVLSDNTTPRDTLSVNGLVGSSAQSLTSYTQFVTSSSIGTITFTITAPSAAVFSGVALDTNPAVAVVPEPSSLVLLGSSILAFVGYSRRRKYAGSKDR
jgi:hypothetical protein